MFWTLKIFGNSDTDDLVIARFCPFDPIDFQTQIAVSLFVSNVRYDFVFGSNLNGLLDILYRFRLPQIRRCQIAYACRCKPWSVL